MDTNNNVDEEFLSSGPVTPSVDYINAISEFFDTDPEDLLVELGYYQRETMTRGGAYRDDPEREL
jgi:hypothetical protein